MRVHVRTRSRTVLTLALLLAFGIALWVSGAFYFGSNAANRANAKPPTPTMVIDSASSPENPQRENDIVLASPGRIEARTDTVEVGAGVDGLIQTIFVREGQRVVRGQVLAELDCRELRAALPAAQFEAESLRQVRTRLLTGSRQEERQAAAQRTARALAVLTHARAQVERQRQLAEAKAVAPVLLEDAQRDFEVAESEYALAQHNEALVNANPLAEELAKADADFHAAETRAALAQEKLSKCVIQAPATGTVLRVLLHAGEPFALISPRPILTMADVSGRRVRAEIDERDIGKVHEGQALYVSSEALSGKRFQGKVSHIALVMGRKSIDTGEPSDKTDRDILEVLADLDPASTALPIGLRVTVYVQR